MFKAIHEYIRKNGIGWSKCVDICSDRIKVVAANASSSRCILHRHSLATKKMPQDLKDVLDGSVKIINHVKSRPLEVRLLKLTAEDMGMDHFNLLLYIEVRWLSRGTILGRLFELKDPLIITFTNKSLIQELKDINWLLKLLYLLDIFEIINKTTTSLQGKAFFKTCVEKKNLTNEITPQTSFFEIVIVHLQGLKESIVNCFPDNN
ncbi:zinc finger BED domain-containing protein 5-like [Diabrotica undecimpunctata]|uniref:zinc finger BED domain-containing protein 5-like n=1 Tax=Diabrotica undecimpunctata TaxID=50387 RepID=UPI003B637ADC